MTTLSCKNHFCCFVYFETYCSQEFIGKKSKGLNCVMESSSSKRAKAPGNIAHCLVDGCNANLSECREYHRRHKVCEVHSKTAKVTISGRDQRFCQQCSRFHSLVEFDDGKRSCRKRLVGHNRRRRKPQLDSMAKNSGLLFGQQVLSSAWTGVVKTDSDMVLYNNQSHISSMDSQNLFPDSSTHSYKGGRQFQFMQGSDHSLNEDSSFCRPLLDHPTSAAGISCSGQKIFSSGLNEIIDSRALSLLSSAPAVTREIGLSRMVQQPSSTSRSQSHGLQYGGLSHFPFAQDFNYKPQDSHVSNSSSPLHFDEMLQNTQDGAATSGASQQTLAFMWD